MGAPLTLANGETLYGSCSNASAVTYVVVGVESSGTNAIPKTLSTGQLANTATAMYTPSGSNSAVISMIWFYNSSGSATQTVALYQNGTSVDHHFVTAILPISGKASLGSDGWWNYDASMTKQYVGSTGPQGAQGVAGGTGSQGAQGSQGAPGAQGSPGAQGAGGSTGAQGSQGSQGATGAPGAVNSVTSTGGTLTITGTTTTNAEVANQAQATFLGRAAGAGTGPPSAQSASAAKTALAIVPGDLVSLGAGVATFMGTASSANLAAALTDETGSGAAVFANAAILKPKDIEGRVYIDPANTQGWSGSDFGAWVNAAFAYLTANYYNGGTQVGGGIIEIAPGAYSQSTAIVCCTAGESIIIRGSGDGWGATVATWTPTSGVAWTLGGGGSNSGGVQLEDITISGGGTVNPSTGLQLGNVSSGLAGGTLKNVAVVRFASGIPWFSASTVYGICLMNCKVQFCTVGVSPLGENNVFMGGLIGNNGTGIAMAGASEVQAFGVAFDDNTTTALNVSNNNARISLDGCRFENAGGGTTTYITQSAGSVSMVSGAFQNDTSGGTSTGFVQQTGGVSKYDGVWHGLGGTQVMTQCYNPTTPASIQVVNPIVAPGSNATALASLNWLPSSYDMAIAAAVATATTTETIIKQRIVPLNTTDIGTTFRVQAHGTQVTANTGLVWKLHYGPLGTTADPIVFASVTVAVATTAGASLLGTATIRTVGATGTIIGNCFSQGTTSTSSLTTATVLGNSTQTNILTLTATAAAGTLTVQNALIEALQPN